MRALLLPLGFVAGLTANACVLPNPDHCDNLALDPNVWCAARYEDRPYCSPCEADNNGCVASEPSADECPGYTPSPDSESGTGAETETGSETETS